MNKKKLIWFILALILVFVIFESVEGTNEVEEVMFKRAKEINSMKIKYDNKLYNKDLATDEQLRSRIHWLGFWSKELATDGYNWKRLWKDSYCIVWQESCFVNYLEHDKGEGFGFIAMKWKTAQEIAKRHRTDFNKLKIQKSSKRQSEFLIRYLMWLYNYYDGNREKAITGYNTGTNLDDNYMYNEYWLKVSGRINELDKWLEGGMIFNGD